MTKAPVVSNYRSFLQPFTFRGWIMCSNTAMLLLSDMVRNPKRRNASVACKKTRPINYITPAKFVASGIV